MRERYLIFETAGIITDFSEKIELSPAMEYRKDIKSSLNRRDFGISGKPYTEIRIPRRLIPEFIRKIKGVNCYQTDLTINRL